MWAYSSNMVDQVGQYKAKRTKRKRGFPCNGIVEKSDNAQ